MFSFRFIQIFAFIFLLQLIVIKCNHRVKRIVGGRIAAKPPPDDPVVFIRLHDRYSRIEGFRNPKTGIYSFLGLHYADPPVGQNRFTRPKYRRPHGNIDATKNGSPCPQPDPNNPQNVVGNEDCLLLNIFTPQMPDETSGRPVYVWIHPGGFRYGSAAQYGAEPIAQRGIILVPIQYRLGTLGVVGEGTKDFSGNLAMMDMSVALRWVTEYISFFGGDPKQVKVIGHGSGAASAMYLSMSRMPKSGGTEINGVVSMSGSALSQYATDTEPVQTVQEIAKINECPTENELQIIECMRSRSVEDIILKDSKVQTERLQGRAMIEGVAGSVGFNPHIEVSDDHRALPGFITEQPNDIIGNGTFTKVPLLIGVSKHETGNALTINTITKIWGNAEQFLKSLLTSVNKLKSFLKIDQVTGEILKPVLPGLDKVTGGSLDLNTFLKVPDNLNPEQVLSKITETTTDVLFNLPAVLSADLWGRLAPSFLYSFEYNGGKTSSGYDFLKGLPIVSSKRNSNFTAHGDELGYLFDVQDLFGKPLSHAKLKSEEDIKVRHNFIGFLANFAKIDVKTEPQFGGGDSIFTRFTGKGSPFIKITDTVKSESNFRFCELSLWGAPVEAIQTTTCQGLAAFTKLLGNPKEKITGILNEGSRGILGGLGGNGNKNSNSVTNSGNILGDIGNIGNKNRGTGTTGSLFNFG